MRAALDAGSSAAGAGLVPSINNGKTVFRPGATGPAALVTARDRFSEVVSGRLEAETITVDHLQARCTRLRKNLGVAAKWLSQGDGQAWMLTFTYRDDVEWKASHVKEALRHLRLWLDRTYGLRLRYLWVMETKARLSGDRKGEFRPHYHCVVWLPKSVHARDLHLDARGWWPHGMTNAVMAIAPVRYVMKYASKFDSKGAFPKGARCYGIGGMDSAGRSCRRWVNWPTFVQARADVRTKVARRPGGGWLVAGVGYASEWTACAHALGATRLARVCTHPPTGIEPVGPFSFLAGTAAA